MSNNNSNLGKRKIALPWIITFSTLTIGFTFATWAGILPYAPIYLSSPFGGGHIETVYFLGALALVMIVFLLMLFLIANIFSRWRDRERKVSDSQRFHRVEILFPGAPSLRSGTATPLMVLTLPFFPG